MIRDKIRNNLLILKNFGVKYAIDDLLESIIFRKNNKLGHFAHKLKYENAKKYLYNNYSNIIEEYRRVFINESKKKITKNAPIFVFWWQGEKDMPKIVKACVDSIKRNCGSHPFNLITKDNYYKYVEIPEYILEKLNSKIITLTHFSDILRMTLLYEYGGI